MQTDPASWYPSAGKPGIYWRLAGIPRKLEDYPTAHWLEAKITGHVLTPSSAGRLEWTRRIHQALMSTRRIEMSDGSPLFIEAAGADSSAHMIRDGQITVMARFGVLIPQPESELIESVYVR